MRLVLVGPPGSGKGTQARLLTERLQLRYIATGEALREAIRQQTATGKAAKPYIDQGRLVPDDLVNQLVADIFRSDGRPDCFVLDGYPRTQPQAVWFDQLLKSLGLDLDAVLHFVISDEEVVERICGRMTCPNPKCGAAFHIRSRPPKTTGICDVCGSQLSQRDDDCDITVRRRLQVYHENTDELVAHYKRAGLLREIPTNGAVEVIYEKIMTNLKPKS